MPGYRVTLLFNNINTNARPETNNAKDTNKDRWPGNSEAEQAPSGKFLHIKCKEIKPVAMC